MIIALTFCASSCNPKENQEIMKNPLLQEFTTPFEVPPFDKISLEDYAPAIRYAIKVHNEEIEKIKNSSKKPDFKNTIVAYELSGS
jgi:peptidyl-dipeptidase Dcp